MTQTCWRDYKSAQENLVVSMKELEMFFGGFEEVEIYD